MNVIIPINNVSLKSTTHMAMYAPPPYISSNLCLLLPPGLLHCFSLSQYRCHETPIDVEL